MLEERLLHLTETGAVDKNEQGCCPVTWKERSILDSRHGGESWLQELGKKHALDELEKVGEAPQDIRVGCL
jgi:hypothetical protein